MPRPRKTEEEIEIGDLVKHPKWGEGTVLSKTGRDEHTKVVVVFPEAGQKKLLVKYARLKKVRIKKQQEEKEAEELEEDEEEEDEEDEDEEGEEEFEEDED